MSGLNPAQAPVSDLEIVRPNSFHGFNLSDGAKAALSRHECLWCKAVLSRKEPRDPIGKCASQSPPKSPQSGPFENAGQDRPAINSRLNTPTDRASGRAPCGP